MSENIFNRVGDKIQESLKKSYVPPNWCFNSDSSSYFGTSTRTIYGMESKNVFGLQLQQFLISPLSIPIAMAGIINGVLTLIYFFLGKNPKPLYEKILKLCNFFYTLQFRNETDLTKRRGILAMQRGIPSRVTSVYGADSTFVSGNQFFQCAGAVKRLINGEELTNYADRIAFYEANSYEFFRGKAYKLVANDPNVAQLNQTIIDEYTHARNIVNDVQNETVRAKNYRLIASRVEISANLPQGEQQGGEQPGFISLFADHGLSLNASQTSCNGNRMILNYESFNGTFGQNTLNVQNNSWVLNSGTCQINSNRIALVGQVEIGGIPVNPPVNINPQIDQQAQVAQFEADQLNNELNQLEEQMNQYDNFMSFND
ncbi:MAG: hypothetical protein N2035_00190 [Chthoniobacterales bacterium]|nr:hypothetical protein [Chthoniobacterales bacterium]